MPLRSIPVMGDLCLRKDMKKLGIQSGRALGFARMADESNPLAGGFPLTIYSHFNAFRAPR